MRLDRRQTDAPQAKDEDSFYRRNRRRVHHAYQLLKERLDYQERVCSALRHSEHLEIHYADRLSEKEVRRVWDNYLNLQRDRHRRWLAVYTVLAALGLLLIPIPGPNVFSFYPAALALGRFLALRGIKSVRQSAVISFHPEPLVADLEGSVDSLEQVRAEIRILEERFGVTHLEELLASK